MSLTICDPLYNYMDFDEGEERIVSHPIFQRLRHIKQFGFSDQAFPTATHNRFSHSLGVCHLSGLAFDKIFKDSSLKEEKKKLFKRTLRLAALLHDIGHGPFSHSSEDFMPSLKDLKLSSFIEIKDRKARHEDYTVKILMEEEGLKKDIEEIGLKPQAVARLLHPDFKLGEEFFKEEGLDYYPILKQILSSDFDVDRMDYLRRDSYFCGVNYGLIDAPWLLSHSSFHVEKGRVFLKINYKALYTVESLAIGRQHMRLIVYFHRTPIIYDKMLKNFMEEEEAYKLPTSSSSKYSKVTDKDILKKVEESQESMG